MDWLMLGFLLLSLVGIDAPDSSWDGAAMDSSVWIAEGGVPIPPR